MDIPLYHFPRGHATPNDIINWLTDKTLIPTPLPVPNQLSMVRLTESKSISASKMP